MSERNQFYTPYIRDRNEIKAKRAAREATPRHTASLVITLMFMSIFFISAFIVSPVMGFAMIFFSLFIIVLAAITS